MELREINNYEAIDFDLPVSEPGIGEISTWYALCDDEEEYVGFMEVTRNEEDFSEISYFIIPDIYQGNGYGALMLEKFLDMYIPQSDGTSMLTAFFDYTGDHGEDFSRILSDHGFDLSLRTNKECYLPFETVYKKLSVSAASIYDSMMSSLAESRETVVSALENAEDCLINPGDVRDADPELSVAAVDAEGNLKALLLASGDIDRYEAVVTDLYVAPDSKAILKSFLSFAVRNAAGSINPPEYISFAAADEKLEKVMTTFLDPPYVSAAVTAEAEFNLGKYIEQQMIADSLGR